VGFSVAVAGDGEVIISKGYGLAEVEHDVANDAETMFRVGLVTKQFTAAGILRLAEQGKISLDDNISDYFPAFPVRGNTITIRHLLSHTSGIKSFTGVSDFWEKSQGHDLDIEQLLAFVSDLDFDFTPGDQYKYSNTGYLMLGAIIEQVSGMSYCQFLSEEFFKPLGLKRIRCDSNRAIIHNRAQGYSFETGELTSDVLQSVNNYGGAGQIIASANDLIRWNMALMHGRVISPASLEAMTHPTILPSGQSTGYGFGFNLGEFRGHRAVTHSGGVFGFSAMLVCFPDEDLYISVLSNVFGGKAVAAQSLVRDIAAIVFGIEKKNQ
jgi:D-alanyl-D-alanine carboxypeptidase